MGDQRADDRLHAGARQILRLFAGLTGEWMLDDHYGVLGQPQGLGPERAAWVNAWVMTVTAARPRFSASMPSWRPHAVQDPQSATAWMTASQVLARWSKIASGVGMLWLIFR